MDATITFEDFVKIDIRVGTITVAEEVPKSKLLKLDVNFGTEIGTRTILAGIAKDFEGNLGALLGQQIVAVVNLPPREMKGIMSNGMILACHGIDNKIALVSCAAPDGAKVG